MQNNKYKCDLDYQQVYNFIEGEKENLGGFLHGMSDVERFVQNITDEKD